MFHLIEQEVVEQEFGHYIETYYVGEWRERNHVPSAMKDFNVALRWNVDDQDIWIVNTTDGRFRASTKQEDMECREYQASLGYQL